MSKVTAEQYLSMWLSEQIPIMEWQRIIKQKTDVNELYQKHLENKNDQIIIYTNVIFNFL